ncbi:MAG: type II toxin-antitoxin system mRNA interferase toxin, RelE/StbE family, partial [Fidelibacterota bacterium]
MYKVVFTKQAQKDAKKLAKSKLKDKATKILKILSKDPFQKFPPYEKLLGYLTGTFSRRVN